ncbi:MAG: DUF4176 domain-containing protein [Lachnospiraceae bacterium]|nr:DUF4176 domain-containing protein [Lachnospiraceae bacterium]
MEHNIDFLPLGSVVIVKGNIKKIVIVARGLIIKVNGQMRLFDYGGVLYPEGMLSDEIVYFNHKDIKNVVHTGFKDGDDELIVENINEWINESEIKHGEPYEINLQKLKSGTNNIEQS